MSNSKIKIQNFLMIEFICAVGLLGIITICFFMTVSGMKKAEGSFRRENRAILVLDNSLERISFLKTRKSAKIKAIFEDEYKKSNLYENKKLFPDCDIRKNKVILSFKDSRDRTIAKVAIETKD